MLDQLLGADLPGDLRTSIVRRSEGNPGSSIASEQEFAIKHALTREVAYGSVPRARRARLHAGFADWLERTAEGRDELASFIAHHFSAAVRPADTDLAWAESGHELDRLREKVVLWLRRASELALGRCEVDGGLRLLHDAQELASKPSAQAEIWRAIGHANALKFDGGAFLEAMNRSLEIDLDDSSRAETFTELAFHT